MQTKIFFFCALVTISAALAGCGGGTTTTPNTNTATAANTANSSDPLKTNKAEPEQVVNNAPTITPVFKAYCEAWQKMDEAALRKTYSAETLRQYEAEMKEEKTQSLLKMLATDKMEPAPCEARNEKITGDSAVATVVTSRYPNGIAVIFVKENGEWKMTNRSPAKDAVVNQQPPAANKPK